ncbi:AAA family ATPase, partial [Pseudomonas aeruginosa]|nr:AAA family ATPase [Pseudomonas aeruginosa]MBH8711544.1 AAA family ATPase [Pseudomonas aeruginosa]
MESRQIVVISGKACSGKSGLARLLEKEYGFRVVRDRRVSQDAEWNLNMPQTALIDRRRELTKAENAPWMLEATKAICLKEQDGRPLVVDHLNSLSEVQQFRLTFGTNLVHVHLYASEPTLRARYAERSELGESSAYDQVNQLNDPAEIDALKKDADVRIYTERSDSSDTLVRVAARLHLYTPPDIRCVDVLIGGQY